MARKSPTLALRGGSFCVGRFVGVSLLPSGGVLRCLLVYPLYVGFALWWPRLRVPSWERGLGGGELRARCSFARVAACRRCLLEVLAGGACWCCLLELLAGAARCGLLGLLVGGAWRCFLLCCLLVRPAVAAAAVCGWDSRPDYDSVAFIYLSVNLVQMRSQVSAVRSRSS